MRVHETNPAAVAKNREQGVKAQVWGGCIFAVGMVILVLAGPSLALSIVPVLGLAMALAGAMVRDSNKGC